MGLIGSRRRHFDEVDRFLQLRKLLLFLFGQLGRVLFDGRVLDVEALEIVHI